MTDKIMIISTCGSAEEASKIAYHLIDKKLAACVNISAPVRSIYRWQGKVEESPEVLMLVKTRRDLLDAVRKALEGMHSYQLPEVIALPIVDGSEAYLLWLEGELVRNHTGD
jgi:periplasmic divalent cation tolerance protein